MVLVMMVSSRWAGDLRPRHDPGTGGISAPSRRYQPGISPVDALRGGSHTQQHARAAARADRGRGGAAPRASGPRRARRPAGPARVTRSRRSSWPMRCGVRSRRRAGPRSCRAASAASAACSAPRPSPPCPPATGSPGGGRGRPRGVRGAGARGVASTPTRTPPSGRWRCFEQALGLWHGRPFAELEEWEAGRLEAARLNELRLAVVEDLLQARLDAGDHRGVAAAATVAAGEEPFRERRWAILALAQYRGGRQADALASIRTARRMLGSELGLDPGSDLVVLEHSILSQDPSARRPTGTSWSPARTAPGRDCRRTTPGTRTRSSGARPRSPRAWRGWSGTRCWC